MRCYIITKAKKVITKDVDSKNQYLMWNNGAYKLEQAGVNLSCKATGINPTAELVFYEDNALPINVEPEKEGEDSSLDEIIIKTALEDVSGAKPFSWQWLHELTAPSVISALFIAFILLYLFLTGGLHL